MRLGDTPLKPAPAVLLLLLGLSLHTPVCFFRRRLETPCPPCCWRASPAPPGSSSSSTVSSPPGHVIEAGIRAACTQPLLGSWAGEHANTPVHGSWPGGHAAASAARALDSFFCVCPPASPLAAIVLVDMTSSFNIFSQAVFLSLEEWVAARLGLHHPAEVAVLAAADDAWAGAPRPSSLLLKASCVGHWGCNTLPWRFAARPWATAPGTACGAPPTQHPPTVPSTHTRHPQLRSWKRTA